MSAQSNALSSLHPGIAPHVNALINGFDSRLGSVKIRDECCSLRTTYPRQNKRPNDRFKIVLPYAGHSLVWEVRFDVTCLDHPPDFIFDDQSFLSSLDADELMQKVPSLLTWDIRNPSGLLEIINQLVALYTQHQFKSIANTSSKLVEQCEKLITDLEVEVEQIQILIGGIPLVMQGSSRPPMNTVNMLIWSLEKQIPVSCGGIELRHREMSLEVLVREYTFHPKLYRSPVLVDMLGKFDITLNSPFKVDELFDFVRRLCSLMSDQIQEYASSWLKREEFHHKLYASLSDSDTFTCRCLEFDGENFTRSSFHLESPKKRSYVLNVVTTSQGCVHPEISLKQYLNFKISPIELKIDDPWDSAQVVEVISEKFSEEEADSLKNGP